MWYLDDIPEVAAVEEEQEAAPAKASRKMSETTLSPDIKGKLRISKRRFSRQSSKTG